MIGGIGSIVSMVKRRFPKPLFPVRVGVDPQSYQIFDSRHAPGVQWYPERHGVCHVLFSNMRLEGGCMSQMGMYHQRQPVRKVSFLGFVTKAQVESGPDQETTIYLDGNSSVSKKLAVVTRSRNPELITLSMCDGLDMATAVRAFEYRGIPVTPVDFSLVDSEKILKTCGSVRNNVSFEPTPILHVNGNYFRIPRAVDKETMGRSGTVLETMIYLLYVLGNQNFGNLTFSEPPHFLCRATQSTLPDRVFLLTLHRPAPGNNFTLEIVHSRMGDSYPNMYELQTVSGG